MPHEPRRPHRLHPLLQRSQQNRRHLKTPRPTTRHLHPPTNRNPSRLHGPRRQNPRRRRRRQHHPLRQKLQTPHQPHHLHPRKRRTRPLHRTSPLKNHHRRIQRTRPRPRTRLRRTPQIKTRCLQHLPPLPHGRIHPRNPSTNRRHQHVQTRLPKTLPTRHPLDRNGRLLRRRQLQTPLVRQLGCA